MAKPENDEHYPEKQTWNTLEELLLACAVHRYGIDSWDSVSVEIQKRNSALRTLTAADCRHKYHDLKRRFSWKLASSGSGDEISDVPWLEELRKLRVDELRREVERYDLSISSLQLKVKRLEEEREKSIKETDTETDNSDLDKMVETMKENHRESDNNLNIPVAKPPDQSVNESNSPDPKDNSPGTGSENANRDEKIEEPVEEQPNRSSDGDGEDTKPAREDSCRGSCESVAKESAENSDKVDSVKRERNESPEFVESMAESKGEEEAKETSDVQSSASLPRKETVEQDEPDNEDQSRTVKWIHVESQPLIDFIEILHSNPIGSHFSRRLESQETAEYDKIIRQHIDTEMIRNRIEAGYYKSSTRNFLRDLLLLINNARVFYGERSSEFKSLEQLIQLVKKQMAFKIPKQTSKPKEESLVTTKEVTVSSPTSCLKPKMSVPIIACRKRSSLAVRSSMSGTESQKKKMRVIPVVDVKQVTEKEDKEEEADEEEEEEEEDETSDKDEEPLISKKSTRSSRTSSTAKKVANRNVKSRDSSSNAGPSSKGRSSNDSSEHKKAHQEKNGNTNASSKRQSAVSFLKRMKGISSSKTVVETTKPIPATDSSSGKRGTEQRKNNSKTDKVDAGKPPASQKRATGKKPTNDKGSPAKKNTGTAPKRGAAPSSHTIGKKGKEASEKETASSARPKKRSRR